MTVQNLPTSVIALSDLVNQEVAKTQSTVITTDGTYGSVTLSYSPRSKTTLADGTVVPSSVSVSIAAQGLSEVYYLSALTTVNVFFTDVVAKKLYFNANNIGNTATIAYNTLGDIVNADIVNGIQNDLRYIESAFNPVLSTIISGKCTINTDVSLTTTTDIADVYVLLGGVGATPIYTLTAASPPTPAKVSINMNSATEASYLILVKA